MHFSPDEVGNWLPLLRKSAPFLSWFEDEKMAEQSKIGSNVKESFAQMDEGGNVEDQVGVQIHQLNPIKMKKTSEKFTGWQS